MSPCPSDDAAEPAPEHDDDLLTRTEASDFLKRFGIRMKPATLARAWSTGSSGPPCRHVRGRPRYPRAVLQAWAEGQVTGLRRSARDPVRPASEAPPHGP